MKHIIATLLSLFIGLNLFAGSGQITGKVTDEKGEPLTGASVLIEGTTTGARTDLDGKFIFKNLDDKSYNLVVTYLSYEKKVVSDILIKGGNTVNVDINLTKAGKGLKEVVIKTAMKKESINALLIQQKNLSTISDGISAEMIKRTADRNTGDVLKRVSGVTITDNKFAVIRGLADRYNMAMLNGDILPSSEADRKAFSFDIFPSNLLENIVIIKAATPDRPAEFAGGIIDLTTKDIPSENFLNIQLGTGYNTISTFKSYHDSKNGKTDWLGFDKSLRVLPSSFPTTEKFYSNSSQFSSAQRIEASKSLNNSWGTTQGSSMSPFRSVQLSAGYTKSFKKEMSFGLLGAVSYSRNLRTYNTERSELNGETIAYTYNDTVNRDNVLVGTLLNAGFKINNLNKITFKNTFTINSDDQTVRRNGDYIENQQYIRGTALWFASNQLMSNQLSSEHLIGKRKIKLQLGLGRNTINRTIPDLRKTYYTQNYPTDTVFRAYVPAGKGSPNYSGRFFSKTKETIYSGNADLTIPYKIMNVNQSVKVGAYVQQKDRNYDARVLGYKIASIPKYNPNLELLPEDQIFAPENMNENGFVIDDITLPTDQYSAKSSLKAAYIMSDNKIMENLRFVFGVRMEDFQQTLNTKIGTQEVEVKKHNTNFLPSLNFTYLLNQKTNIRLCASQTLSRPEFRELAPAAFYDYNMSATYIGNTDLVQTKIQNYDLRYEYFMGKGEMVSASVFYKKFLNPIEASVPYGIASTSKVFSYQNAPDANNYGVELEFRKSMASLTHNEKSLLNDISFFGNFAYIKSVVDISTTTASGEKLTDTRPMQGQSPYIINGGVSYVNPKINFNATLVYNRIGQRIVAVGNGEIPHMWEAPRNVIDLQLSKRFYKKIEVKLSISDLLSNPVVLYYNMKGQTQVDKTLSYDKQNDFNVVRTRQGSNMGLSVSYQFGK
ncbi:MAG: TonB-dependent receptor [Chitinophagaceae bacterium]|nr:TonB-dependent receptor [Chitinophagaceae bacterium]